MGKLVVKVICGRNLKGSDMFSDADGYIKLTLGSKTFRTKAIDNNANPNWNESFSFFVSEANCDNLKLELWDANTFKDDLLADAVVPLNDLVKDTRVLKRVNFSGGKGEVHLELLADFGAPGSNSGGQQSLNSSYSSAPSGYAPPPTPPQPSQTPGGGYANPYGGANPYAHANPYAQPPQQQQQQQQPQYSHPGQNPYAGQQYYQQQAPQQQPPRPPQQPPQGRGGGGGYPSAASYASAPQQYQNPYSSATGAPQNPYATQYPGGSSGGAGGGTGYAYPGYSGGAPQQQQQQRPPQQAGGGGQPQPGGLGYLPSAVGGVNYY